jgi:photosystem II stability/assembly factor-like uncharacterized protein
MLPAAALAMLLQSGPERSVTLPASCQAASVRTADAESVLVDPQDANHVRVVADGAVFETLSDRACLVPADDGLGRTPPPCFRDVDPFVLSADPQLPETLYLGSSQGVYKSSDGGRSWEPRNIGIPFVICEADMGRVAVDPARSNVLFVSGLGIFKSSDGAETWELAQSGFPADVLPAVSEFAFDPRDTDVVYAATYRLFKTVNGAQLWEPSDQGLPGPAYSVAVNLRNPDVVHVGTTEGVFVSHDAGASWAPEGLTGREVYDLQQKIALPQVFIAQTDAGLYRSTNGGVLWSPLPTPFPPDSIREFALAPSDPSTIYAATDDGVYRSRDDGATWELLGLDRRAPRYAQRPVEPPQ